MNSVVWPGKIFGTFMFAPLAERLGYKKTMYIVAVVQCLGLIVQMTAKDWQVFTGGRVIAYAAVGLAENAAPAYIAEISPAGMRGFFGGAIVVIVSVGNLWGALMGRAYATETRKLGWLIPVGVQFIPAVLILVLVPFCIGESWVKVSGLTDARIAALARRKGPQRGGHSCAGQDSSSWRRTQRPYPRRDRSAGRGNHAGAFDGQGEVGRPVPHQRGRLKANNGGMLDILLSAVWRVGLAARCRYWCELM